MLQRFALTESRKRAFVFGDESEYSGGVSAGILAECPTNGLAMEELSTFHVHHAIGKQPVGVGPLLEHQLVEDRTAGDPQVIGLDPLVHFRDEVGMVRDHRADGVDRKRVDGVPPGSCRDEPVYSGKIGRPEVLCSGADHIHADVVKFALGLGPQRGGQLKKLIWSDLLCRLI